MFEFPKGPNLIECRLWLLWFIAWRPLWKVNEKFKLTERLGKYHCVQCAEQHGSNLWLCGWNP